MNFEKLTKIDRRVIFLVMAVVIAFPMLVSIDLPMSEQKPTVSLFETIEAIDPEEQILLVSTDYSPHTEAENQPMTIAILRHAFAKRLRVLMVSLYIESAGLAADAMDKTMEEFNARAVSQADSIVYGRDIAFLGWQPPPIVPILSMGESIAGIYPVDFYGNKTDSLSVMRGVNNYDDVGLVMAMSGGEGPKWYVQFAQTKFGVEVGAGVTAVNTPDYYPYYETGQFSGMMGGMKGAAEYEGLVERKYGGDGRKRATEGMGSQSAAHMMIILFVLLGNIAYFAGRGEESPMNPDTIWIWVGAFLTLCIFSFLYRDNPFYRFGEHLYVGVANGYLVAFMWHRVIVPVMLDPFIEAFRIAGTDGLSMELFNPVAPANFLLIIPALIGCLYFMRFVRRYAWLVRIPIGIFMGYYVGVTVPALFEGTVFPQMRGTVLSRGSFEDPVQGIWAILVLIGVLTTLAYFFFSREQKGIYRLGAKTGIVYIMVGFGASFGFTVMARVSLVIGRFLFLLRDWLGLIS